MTKVRINSKSIKTLFVSLFSQFLTANNPRLREILKPRSIRTRGFAFMDLVVYFQAMKNILILLLISISASAQTSYLGFAANRYTELSGSGETTVSRSITIVYNQYYCVIYRDGSPTISFPVSGLKQNDDGSESFVNDESETNEYGWYLVNVTRTKKDGNTVIINLTKIGVAYMINDAHVYSANGEVTGYIEKKISQERVHKAPTTNTQVVITLTAADRQRARDSMDVINKKKFADEQAAIIEKRRKSDSLNDAAVKNLKW